MKYIRFQKNDEVAYGIVEGDTVIEITAAPYESHKITDRTHGLEEVKLLAPCLPSKIFAMAGNYLDHLKGQAPPEEPRPFVKVPSSVIGPEDTIILPADQEKVDEEGELVVVIGKPCRRCNQENAWDFVFGYTCGNDVSARVWQKNDLNWWRAKSSDTFSPIGPHIVTDIDATNQVVVARVNGEEVQRCNTKDFIHDIPYLMTFLSRSVTLLPGDLIYTGTTGVPAALSDGDVVEVEISDIGTLRNIVESE